MIRLKLMGSGKTIGLVELRLRSGLGRGSILLCRREVWRVTLTGDLPLAGDLELWSVLDLELSLELFLEFLELALDLE